MTGLEELQWAVLPLLCSGVMWQKSSQGHGRHGDNAAGEQQHWAHCGPTCTVHRSWCFRCSAATESEMSKVTAEPRSWSSPIIPTCHFFLLPPVNHHPHCVSLVARFSIVYLAQQKADEGWLKGVYAMMAVFSLREVSLCRLPCILVAVPNSAF